MPNFYLICGVSGGGKTTLSKHLALYNPSLHIFDVDKYYEKINGDECDRSNWFDVWITLWQDLHKSELANEDVLLTTNALTVSQRTQFVEWFPTFTHHILWVTASKEMCFIGNKARRRHVPEDKLLKDWDRMEFPNASEKGWDTITQFTRNKNGSYTIFRLKGNIDDYIKLLKEK